MKKGLLLISLVLIIGLSMIFTSCGDSGTPAPTTTSNTPGATTSAAPTATNTQPTSGPSYSVPKPAGLETELYTNDEYKFSIEIPKGWTLKQETQGQYIVFKWVSPTAEAIPNFVVTIRNFMQPILLETFITKFETEIYNASYTKTSTNVISEGLTATEYTMTITNEGGSAVDVMGDTIYHQHGINFYTVTTTVNKTGNEDMRAILKYCASTYKTTQLMG